MQKGGKITALLKSIGVPDKKIKELPTGIEPEWLVPAVRQPENIRKFIFVGRYEHRKGIDELNTVLKTLKQESFEFVFVGPMPEAKQVKQHGIHYTGPVMEAKAMQELIRMADILVCPSHSEGMPNVIMEAMASGLAVIATDVGAVSSMVSESNGWLIMARSEQALKQALLSAMKIPLTDLQKMKEISLKRVTEKFLWGSLVQQLISNMNE